MIINVERNDADWTLSQLKCLTCVQIARVDVTRRQVTESQNGKADDSWKLG